MEIFWVFFLVLSIFLSEASALAKVSHAPSCSANLLEERHVNGSGLHLMLHHAHGPCSPTGLPPRSSSDILEQDERRVQAMIARTKRSTTSHTKSPNYNSIQQPITLRSPLNSGDSVGSGNYMTTIGIGTPAQSNIVIVDTGSSFSWLQCEPCTYSCHAQKGPIFDPKASITYTTVACSAKECNATQETTLNPPSCSSSNTCVYETDYGDGSYSVGYLSKETLSFAGGVIPGFIFGCGQDNEGLFGKSAGLLGLAKDGLSMLGQLSRTYGNSFSYCLPTSSATGYLSFGPYLSSQYTFTPMLTNPLDKNLYFLKLVRVLVGGKPVPLSNPADYMSNPTIIDSGTVVTRLPDTVYSALSQTIAKALRGYRRVRSPITLFDTCFVGSYKQMGVPAVRLEFDGGAGLDLLPHNVFYDVKKRVTCLAFSWSRDMTIIGNLQHQTFDVVYDVENSKIGFGARGCK